MSYEFFNGILLAYEVVGHLKTAQGHCLVNGSSQRNVTRQRDSLFRSSVRKDLMAASFISQSVSVSNFKYTLFASFISF